jgi:hypothetical protein
MASMIVVDTAGDVACRKCVRAFAWGQGRNLKSGA